MSFPHLIDVFAPVQLLAWVAALIYFISYQKQSSNKTILLWAPADMFMLAHFFFMGAPLFMMTALGGTIRSLISVYCSKRTLSVYLILYLVVLACAFPFLADGLKDYIAYLGTTLFSLSVWFKDSFVWHRLFAFGHQVSWMIAFLLLGSYGGLVLIFIMFSSNVVGTARYVLANKRNLS